MSTQITTTPIVRTPMPQGDADDFGGATRAVEVAAMLGDSVVHVKHCMDPHSGKVTRGTWAFFATGIACLIGSVIAFKTSVDTAAYNKGALEYHTNVRKQPSYSFRPTPTNGALDFLAFGGLALGLCGATAGLVRLRREQKSPFYRVGTAPGVEQPLVTAPSADFPLVAPSGDEFVFNYGAGFDGELTVDGTTTSLADLAQSGRARPSLSANGAIEIPIPARARIRARSGNTTFMISSVGKPKEQPVAMFAVNNRTMSFFAASLAVHLGFVAVLNAMPEDGGSVNLDLNMNESVSMNGDTVQHDETPPVEEVETEVGESGAADAAGGQMTLPEGAAGKPTADRADGHMRIKNTNTDPVLARAQAIEAARDAGILGSSSLMMQSMTAVTGTGDFSSGFDEANIYGPLFGAEGEGRGNFGYGRNGMGVGGGCTQEPCGLVGAGKFGTIGNGDKVGDGWGIPGDSPGRPRRHISQVPTVKIGDARVSTGLDREIIRRYIKRQLASISYCYEKQLLVSPSLAGTVTATFMIQPNGTVQASTATGVADVSGCVATVISAIKFPAPKDGGNVAVTYPFNFHPAGA